MKLKAPASLVGSLIAGFLASICCVGPLVLGVLGAGAFGLAAAIAPLRPWLLGLTGVLLAIAFYFAYRPLPVPECGPDGACLPPISRRGQRISLWVVTVLTAMMATFPEWSSLVSGAARANRPRAASNDQSATHLVTLDIHGMTCADCEQHIEQELDRIPGVVSARVDYSGESGVVQFANRADLKAVAAAVERAGYRASNVHVSERTAQAGKAQSGAEQVQSTLTGEWRGLLAVAEGRTSELVLDMDRAADRWVGQFDLVEFGVEDYPILIDLDGPRVHLNLTAANIDFEGALSARGDSLRGIATSQGHDDPLVLTRAGEPHFSPGFLALEAAAEDSTRVASLAADGAELRKQFNQDRAYTRLLMLLSPT